MNKPQTNEERCAISEEYFNSIPRINNLPFDSEEENEITENHIACSNRAMVEFLREQKRERQIARKEETASFIVLLLIYIVFTTVGLTSLILISKYFGPLSNRALGVSFILIIFGVFIIAAGLWGYVDNVIKGKHR